VSNVLGPGKLWPEKILETFGNIWKCPDIDVPMCDVPDIQKNNIL